MWTELIHFSTGYTEIFSVLLCVYWLHFMLPSNNCSKPEIIEINLLKSVYPHMMWSRRTYFNIQIEFTYTSQFYKIPNWTKRLGALASICTECLLMSDLILSEIGKFDQQRVFLLIWSSDVRWRLLFQIQIMVNFFSVSFYIKKIRTI